MQPPTENEKKDPDGEPSTSPTQKPEPHKPMVFHFQCTRCGACCRDPGTIVNLTYIDILQLKKDLQLSRAQLLDIIGFYIFEKDPSQDQLDKMVVPPIKTENGNAFVALRKHTDGRCVLLDKTNQCSVYEARPYICRTFPFHFRTIPIETPPQLKIHMTFAAKAVENCPGIHTIYPLVNPRDWLKIGETATKNILAEIILVRKWNEAVAQGKIEAYAENYLNVILNIEKESPNTPAKDKENKVPEERKSLRQRARKKLEK